MYKKLFLSTFLILSLVGVSFADGISVIIPKGNYHDVNVPRTQLEGTTGTIRNTISFVNSYLWFLIGFLCFIFLIYNGIKLVSSRGDKEDMKKAMKGLTGAAVGIAICFISYAFVRAMVNLF
jgi:hypothetical protein